MSSHKKKPSKEHVSPNSFDKSTLNSTDESFIYPDLSPFKECGDAPKINTQSILDGSGDHLPFSNSSVSSEDEESPQRQREAEPHHMLRSGNNYQMSPIKCRQGIHKKEQEQSRPVCNNISQRQQMALWVAWWHNYLHISVAVAVITVLLYIMFLQLAQEEKKKDIGEIRDDRVVIVGRFKVLLAELRAQFPSQSKRFWRILQAATQSMLSKPQPVHPAVILLVSDNTSVVTASCIAHHFSKVVAQSYINATHEPALVDCAEFVDQNAKEFKLNIHNALEAKLHAGSNVAIVDNLQMMPGDASVLFHGYCDNENAPYLDATFILTVQMYDVVIEEPDDAVVEDYLDRIWGQDVERENLVALYSRIANNIAFVNAEAPDLIAELCRR